MPSTRERARALMSKQGLVVTELARILFMAVPGGRLAPVQEYAAQLSVGTGTVQAALEYLQEQGAVRLEARGRLGSYAAELSYPLLWSLAFQRPIIGAMPLPYSRRFEGLATGLRQQFVGEPLDLDLRFMRGAAQRMQALASQTCDWALISRWAAETAEAHGFAVQTVMVLGPHSYMGGHSLLLPSGVCELQAGMRIGVDMQSMDHVYLVRAISRGKQVDLQPIDYSQGLDHLRTGAIDATVWSAEDIPADLTSLTVVPLDPQAEPALAPLGEAVIVVNKDNQAMQHVLGAVLERTELLHIQHDVLERNRLPNY
ncbi:MAG: hypothetical protein H0X37_00420 [Herpetosiphonaceae bacterium]|nr:hypothetical protein [Herpetosiphonaceae bacterium]